MTLEQSDPLAEFGMGRELVDCELCGNSGSLIRTDENGVRWCRPCSCMAKRQTLLAIKRSGLEDAVMKKTFSTYQAPDDHRKKLLSIAKRFAKADEGWFAISGRSGSGKTHLCVAIFGELVHRGYKARFVRWREESTKLKGIVTQPDEYQAAVRALVDVPALYVDDFLQGDPTAADIKLAFELIDGRYTNPLSRTIISTERSLEQILTLSEAIGSRIAERSRGYLVKAPPDNWRLSEGGD